ncbi:hypothetical protein D0O09_31305 [Pseudomonas putida]|nr:hypothetical protein D0O09_31305 [Pseudomonas putida]
MLRFVVLLWVRSICDVCFEPTVWVWHTFLDIIFLFVFFLFMNFHLVFISFGWRLGAMFRVVDLMAADFLRVLMFFNPGDDIQSVL